MASLVRPFPPIAKQETFNAHQFQRTSENGVLNCFSLVDPVSGKPSDDAYCANSTNQLSIISGPGSLLVKRADFRKFHGHEVPMDVALLYNGKVAVSAHVTELDNVSTAATSFIADAAASSPFVPASILQGSRLQAPTPEYPKKAKKQHIQGSVLLAAVIDKQGMISGLEVIASPDPLLSESALKAVQKWTYTPYQYKGQPTDVDTTITVNYALGK